MRCGRLGELLNKSINHRPLLSTACLWQDFEHIGNGASRILLSSNVPLETNYVAPSMQMDPLERYPGVISLALDSGSR